MPFLYTSFLDGSAASLRRRYYVWGDAQFFNWPKFYRKILPRPI
jgi:hypothetical protein